MLAQDIVRENHLTKFYRIIFKVLQVFQQNKVSVLHINLVFSIYLMMKWCIEQICEHFINLCHHVPGAGQLVSRGMGHLVFFT